MGKVTVGFQNFFEQATVQCLWKVTYELAREGGTLGLKKIIVLGENTYYVRCNKI